MKISVISPVYQAEPIISILVERIQVALRKITDNFEIILIEDYSKDNSWGRIVENCKKFENVKGIKLSRNYGQQHAIQAGLDASSGEYVITMDCDLQDQPEEIYKLYEKTKQGYEIVVASRQNRSDSCIKKFLSKKFYVVLGYMTGTKQDDTVANFVCYHRSVVEAMSKFKDHRRYYPMIQQIVGFRYTKVAVNHASRESGNSSYSIKKRLDLALDTILTFSDKPLRLIIKLGVVLSFLSISSAIILVIVYFTGNFNTPGWASLSLLMSFFSGSIISVLGMIGLYVGKIFESVKNRPTYIIHKKENF